MARRPQPLRRRNLDGEIARPRDFLEGTKIMVPSKGLEPPHRCRYMDLNHARLPIPPRWQLNFCSGSPQPLNQEDLRFLFYRGEAACQTSARTNSADHRRNIWPKSD